MFALPIIVPQNKYNSKRAYNTTGLFLLFAKNILYLRRLTICPRPRRVAAAAIVFFHYAPFNSAVYNRAGY